MTTLHAAYPSHRAEERNACGSGLCKQLHLLAMQCVPVHVPMHPTCQTVTHHSPVTQGSMPCMAHVLMYSIHIPLMAALPELKWAHGA